MYTNNKKKKERNMSSRNLFSSQRKTFTHNPYKKDSPTRPRCILSSSASSDSSANPQNVNNNNNNAHNAELQQNKEEVQTTSDGYESDMDELIMEYTGNKYTSTSN